MIAGLLVWALTGIGVLSALAKPGDLLAAGQLVAWLVFGVAFLAEGTWPYRFNFRLVLLVQTASALVLIWAPRGEGIEVALLVMIAGQAPAVFSIPACLIWVAAQTGLAFLPALARGQILQAAVPVLAYVAFQLFAVGAASLAESERRAREALAGANGRLEAMQERLAETTREAERLRIARELHDSLGHHLTALGLDLELVRHLVKGDAVAPVERARGLASSLLSELRGAVTELRADSGGDLAERLSALARREGRPRVDLDIAPGPGRVPADVTLALSRVAQEIVTNATKHSKAATVSLNLRTTETAWTLEGRDNGIGTDALRMGHGLSGMKERIEGLGGVLSIETRLGQGFAITATVPASGRA
jgi:signal transduction histidine kinase